MTFKGKKDYAHRWAYVERHGSIPDGLSILHTCHNPKCVRPAHLYAGTPADNAADKVKAKRGRRNLKTAEVIQIVAFHAKGRSVEHLAEQFKVNPRSIRNILSGKSHKKVTGIVYKPKHNHYDKVRKMKEAA